MIKDRSNSPGLRQVHALSFNVQARTEVGHLPNHVTL